MNENSSDVKVWILGIVTAVLWGTSGSLLGVIWGFVKGKFQGHEEGIKDLTNKHEINIAKISRLETRDEELEKNLDTIGEQVIRIEAKIDNARERIEIKIEEGNKDMRDKFDQMALWIMGGPPSTTVKSEKR